MIDENKKKERKQIITIFTVFVILLAAAVGGVYAYFAARVENSGSQITGRTLDINGATLTLTAQRVDLDPDPEPLSDNLV